MPLPTMLTETSNNSVSAPQRDSPDVKAANKERQTIISTVPLVSCCYTEIVACMCKQSTPEKLHNKQFKAVVRNAETWRTRAYGGLDSNLLSSYGVWLPRFCLLRVCVYVGNRERERERESLCECIHMLRQNMTPIFLRQQPTYSFYDSLLALRNILWSWRTLLI